MNHEEHDGHETIPDTGFVFFVTVVVPNSGFGT
jgi:hypothetical protein